MCIRDRGVIDDAFSVSMANPFGIAATIAAYNEGEEWLDQLRDYLDENIRFVKEFVKEQLPKEMCIRDRWKNCVYLFLWPSVYFQKGFLRRRV